MLRWLHQLPRAHPREGTRLVLLSAGSWHGAELAIVETDHLRHSGGLVQGAVQEAGACGPRPFEFLRAYGPPARQMAETSGVLAGMRTGDACSPQGKPLVVPKHRQARFTQSVIRAIITICATHSPKWSVNAGRSSS